MKAAIKAGRAAAVIMKNTLKSAVAVATAVTIAAAPLGFTAAVAVSEFAPRWYSRRFAG